MIAMPWRPKGKAEPKCDVIISEVKFIKGLPKQVEINVKNDGDAGCNLKNIVLIKPSSNQNWTEIQVIWNLSTLPPEELQKPVLDMNGQAA